MVKPPVKKRKTMPSQTILIVDDDKKICELLTELLQKYNFNTITAHNSQQLFSAYQKHAVDLVLLDIMLGNEDGLTLCQNFRKISNKPIIMISAAGEPADRVIGIELGADDYIAKPFYPREVIVRIKAQLRRSVKTALSKQGSELHFSDWRLHLGTQQLFSSNNIEICLSRTELALLKAFLLNAHHVMSREQLLQAIHDDHACEVFDRSIDVQISRLRKRIEVNPQQPQLIKTIRGSGYQFCADVYHIES